MSRAFKIEPHNMELNKRIGRSVCKHCGLVALHNPFSQWSVRMGCNSREHPDYERQRAQAGRRP
jgi:hypothetical protein